LNYVYALVSGEEDFYWEECYLSICSLARHNKEPNVIVLTDDITEKTLKNGFRKKIYDIADVRVIPFESNVGKIQRSRLLKLGVREYVSGKILYIDTDTMICDSLSEVENIECDIAMALDHHEVVSRNIAKSFYLLNSKLTGFSIGYNDRHFNSGVMYVNDTVKANEFFVLWKKMYYEGVKKGIYTDQVSLNGANNQYCGIIEELDGIWNVQLDYGLKYISNAKILHYFNHKSNTRLDKYRETIPYILYNRSIFEELKNNGVIDGEIEKLIDNPKSGILNARMIAPDCLTNEIIGTYQYKIMRVLYVKLHFLYLFNEKVIGLIYMMIKGIRKNNKK
jgi:lipopolysaccharide biosynthesis glycosyltransferase